ncbi:unnamed protein product [Protopolystoma xenopodis]|uniref:Uncharacterized protein n=1 Tax=Protopolystoma xenopodis TaxID=117903 RepID=A0A448XNA6_9PLAT|nr:unnamed protein product [Protopolystoma xenopodis]
MIRLTDDVDYSADETSGNVIPIYGRGGDSTQDPRNKIPPRPAGRRQDSEATWVGSFVDGLAYSLDLYSYTHKDKFIIKIDH